MWTTIVALALAASPLPERNFAYDTRAAQDREAFKGTSAYCYFAEKTLTWRLGNDAVERVVQFDREAGALKTMRVQDKKAGRRIAPATGPEGEFILAPDSANAAGIASVRLDGGWVYMWQSVGTTASGGRLLTIHMQGKGRHQGYEAEAMYEIYTGNRPYLAKSLTLINRTGAPRVVAEVVYDRWILTPPPMKGKKGVDAPRLPAEFKGAPGGAATLVDAASGTGLVAGVLHPQGETLHQGGTVVQRVKVSLEMPGDWGRALTPKSIVAAFSGSAATGATLYQRYVSETPEGARQTARP